MSCKCPVNVLYMSWKHLWNIWKHLWSIWKHLTSSWEKMSAQVVVIHKSYNPAENIGKQLRTSENSWKTSKNSWEHRKTSKIIWYHPENNWGPIIDNLVQFEEDFNSQNEMWSGVGWGGDGYLRPIPRSPDGDKNQWIIMHAITSGHSLWSCRLQM